MSITLMNAPHPKRYGITEWKKAELDELLNLIADAQYEVEQFQSMADSLLEKQSKFQLFLTEAEGNRTRTLNNRNLADQLVKMAGDLKSNASIAFTETGLADNKSRKELSPTIKIVMDKLIYSAEIINRLAILVTRRKAINPLISDDLVNRISTAGSDANKAVALLLVALQSVFTAQATNMESTSALSIAYQQSIDLYNLLTGADKTDPAQIPGDTKPAFNQSLNGRLYKAFEDAKEHYDQTHQAFLITTRQLNNAQTQLTKAQVKLKSLQTGLAAGNAAALAS